MISYVVVSMHYLSILGGVGARGVFPQSALRWVGDMPGEAVKAARKAFNEEGPFPIRMASVSVHALVAGEDYFVHPITGFDERIPPTLRYLLLRPVNGPTEENIYGNFQQLELPPQE